MRVDIIPVIGTGRTWRLSPVGIIKDCIIIITAKYEDMSEFIVRFGILLDNFNFCRFIFYHFIFLASLKSESSDFYLRLFWDLSDLCSLSLLCCLLPFWGNGEVSETFLMSVWIRLHNNDAWLGRWYALHITLPNCGHPSGCIDFNWPQMAHSPGCRVWNVWL